MSGRGTMDQRGMMSMALKAPVKKRLQINISDSKFILESIRDVKLDASLRRAFGQEEQNMILIPVLILQEKIKRTLQNLYL